MPALICHSSIRPTMVPSQAFKSTGFFSRRHGAPRAASTSAGKKRSQPSQYQDCGSRVSGKFTAVFYVILRGHIFARFPPRQIETAGRPLRSSCALPCSISTTPCSPATATSSGRSSSSSRACSIASSTRRSNQQFYDQYRAGTLDIHEFLDFQLKPLARHTRKPARGLAWRFHAAQDPAHDHAQGP